MQKYVNFITFLQKLISKEHVVVIMKFPDWVQVKKKYYTHARMLEPGCWRMMDLFIKNNSNLGMVTQNQNSVSCHKNIVVMSHGQLKSCFAWP